MSMLLSQSSTFNYLSQSKKKNEANKKILMLMEESMANEEWTKALKEGFCEISSSEHFLPENSVDQNGEEIFPFLNITTPFAGLIQWTKVSRDTDLVESNYLKYAETIEAPTVIVIQNEDYCNRIVSSVDGIEFPSLAEYVSKVTNRVKQHTGNQKLQLIFAFVDLDKAILTVQRKLSKENSTCCVQELVDQSLIYLAYSHDIETFRCKKLSALCEYLHTVTRALNSKVEKDATTAFDCVMKASKLKPDENMTAQQKEIFELQQTWAAMLQMIPQISKEKAQTLISNEAYSCPKRVYEALNNENEPENKRMALLQTAFGKTKSGIVRNEAKLSKQVYRLMTVTDRNEMLDAD